MTDGQPEQIEQDDQANMIAANANQGEQPDATQQQQDQMANQEMGAAEAMDDMDQQ